MAIYVKPMTYRKYARWTKKALWSIVGVLRAVTIVALSFVVGMFIFFAGLTVWVYLTERMG